MSRKTLTFLMLDGVNAQDLGKYDRQKDIMLRLHNLAIELDIHIHIVAHPRKPTGFLRVNDISGTANIADLAQNVFLLHRTNTDFFHGLDDFDKHAAAQIEASGCTNVIEIGKCREKGATQGQFVQLWFEPESNRLVDSPDSNLRYAWEEPTPKELETISAEDPRYVEYFFTHAQDCNEPF